MNETDLVPEDTVSELLKYQKLIFLGTIITALFQLVGVFTRSF